MNVEQKLRVAKIAKYFLDRAILEMEAPSFPSSDPDYDLWHAFEDLKKIQDADIVEVARLAKELDVD